MFMKTVRSIYVGLSFFLIFFLNATAQAQTITYTYDTGTNGIGRLSSVTDPTGSTGRGQVCS
jgi:YD repeat-containing protein